MGILPLRKRRLVIPTGFDVLCAGFPCQAFSIAGHRRGFEEARGTLFFDVAEILSRYQPKAFLLENVKGLVSHDKGRTLQLILRILREDLGYFCACPTDTKCPRFGVPQNRERIFIVGFHPQCGVHHFRLSYPKSWESSIFC